jgi:hypothetical protein
MKDSLTSLICPNCGALAESVIEGRSSGMRCTQCDWSVFTTFALPIEKDQIEYEIVLSRLSAFNEEHVKTIANLMNINFLQARKKFTEEAPRVFKGKAKEVVVIKEKLDSIGLVYTIQPEFKW